MIIIKELSDYNSLSLAYISDNKVRSCNLWFVSSMDKQPVLYFISSLSTLHGQALRDGAEVSFTMTRDEQDYLSIKGIQGNGYCKIADRETAREIYVNKFDIINEDRLRPIIENSVFFEIRVNWLRLIDNSISFGHKDEYNF